MARLWMQEDQRRTATQNDKIRKDKKKDTGKENRFRCFRKKPQNDGHTDSVNGKASPAKGA
jgi:hypothetical protein